MDSQSNPWSARNLDEFLYYCCPECDTKNQSKEVFIKHALDNHPNSKEYIVSAAIKNEDEYNYEDINTEDFDTFYDDNEYVEPKTELTEVKSEDSVYENKDIVKIPKELEIQETKVAANVVFVKYRAFVFSKLLTYNNINIHV